jgi:hypothetical protein
LREAVVAGDFNRHNPLWGGSQVSSASSQEESAPIIDFMAELALQSLLPAGVMTFVSDAGGISTIDLASRLTRWAKRALEGHFPRAKLSPHTHEDVVE